MLVTEVSKAVNCQHIYKMCFLLPKQDSDGFPGCVSLNAVFCSEEMPCLE